jgi:hypothetical protein
MDDLERIAVRVEYICGIVPGIVFKPCSRRNIVPGASGDCRLIEFIDLIIAFGHESPVNGRWIGLALLKPKERLLSITKPPQIGMAALALIGSEVLDIERLQCRLIERQ